MRVIEPKVTVVDYGPKVMDKKGKIILTPDEIVYAAGAITYKDTGAMLEILDKKKELGDISEEMKKSLIRSAGAGHASMATTPGIWFLLEGNCSKLVDSAFTGARFSSSLMPSSRRVPIAKDQIVVPKGIVGKGNKAVNLYMKTFERNINLYDDLQRRGVVKQEASKIVPYGHRGGGFMFMPLETLVGFAKDFEDNDLIPLEAREIVKKLEEFVHTHGMEITYESRKAAPRTCCVNPSIFHNKYNMAQEFADKNLGYSPRIISVEHYPSKERDKKIKEYLEKREEIFKDSELIKKGWSDLLIKNLARDTIAPFNDSLNIKIFTMSPWRVWGEVKRHRTVQQTAESIYHATERAFERFNETRNPDDLIEVISIPPAVLNNEKNLKDWIGAFSDSLNTYNTLVYEEGIEPSDAIAVIPRGGKLGIIKNYSLENLGALYVPLRSCGTAEPEMRAITEQEAELIKNLNISPEVKQLITPKCAHTGFCHDVYRPDKCRKVNQFNEDYDLEMHKDITAYRRQEIEKKL